MSTQNPIIIPDGFCQCGCLQPTPVQCRTSKRDGSIRGQHVRFLPGHNNWINGESRFEWMVGAIVKHGTSDDCLLWPWSTDRLGYGQVFFNTRMMRAHSLAYYLHYARLPLPCGRHTCHVRNCFAWRHIVAGTQAQNVQDTINAGRHIRGESVPTAILTAENIPIICANYAAGDVTMQTLAEKYGVTDTAIASVIHGESWKHIPR